MEDNFILKSTTQSALDNVRDAGRLLEGFYRVAQGSGEAAQYFYSPDGFGGYWYDTLAEMKEAHGF